MGSGYEIIGADEIIGYDELDDNGDVDALLGAAPRRPQQQRGRQAAVQKPGGGAAVVRSLPPTTARKMVLGVNSASTVASAASETITVRSQVLFRPTRLLVPDSITPAFIITDIKIGNKSQFAGAYSVPAAAFGEAVDDDLMMDTIQVSQDISIAITNVSLAAVQFRAVLFGDAVY